MARKFFSSKLTPISIEKRLKYKERWDKNHLPVKDLGILVRDLILDGYEDEFIIHYEKVGSYYKVDFAHLKHKHVVELNGKHHTTQLGKQRVQARIRNLEKAGWTVTRIPYEDTL
jgi:very-short-patch-repair endonuclease